MDAKIIAGKINKEDLAKLAQDSFGDIVKAVVDVEKSIMAIGGELHSDEESLLLENGSKQENLWGINIYTEKPESEWIEFDSMINIRPRQGNRSRSVEDAFLREKIIHIVSSLVE